MSIKVKKLIISLLPLAGYAVVVIAVFGRALIPSDTMLLFGDDIHRQYYFYRQFLRQSVASGFLPWWNPYIFSGVPFIANPIVNFWYPLNWMFIFLPLTQAYSLHVALHIFIAMTGMYWVLRNISNFPSTKLRAGKYQISNLASWVGGLVFGLSGFFMARTYAGHVDVLAAASYAPWVFGMFWQAIRSPTPKLIVITGMILALQLYAGYQTMAFFTGLAVGIGVVVHCVVKKSLRPIGVALQAVVIAVGLAALQLLPEQEFFRHSIRTFDFPYRWISYGALTIESLKQFVSPFFFGDQFTYHGPPPNYAEHAFFIGRIPLALTLIGLIGGIWGRRGQKITVILFAVIALFGLWMSLAGNVVFDLQYFLWKVIPMYRFLRLPSRHLVLFVFGASALAGIGFHAIRQRLFQIVLTVLIAAELVLYARHFIVLREIPEARHDADLIAAVTQERELYRMLPNFGVWVPPRDSLDFDAAMSYRIFSVTGYDPSILRNYYEFIDAVNKAESPSILDHDVQVPFLDVSSPFIDFLNIQYVLHPTQYDPIGAASTGRYTLVRADEVADYRLYRNETVLPRFYIVPRLEITPSRQEAVALIRQGSIDPRTTVVTSSLDVPDGSLFKSDCTQAITNQVTITAYTPNSIELDVSAPCSGFLVSSEVMYPGWEAFIDGKKTDIFEGNLAFRTLYLPDGFHKITMRYNPRIFLIAGAISIATLLYCGMRLRVWRARRKP